MPRIITYHLTTMSDRLDDSSIKDIFYDVVGVQKVMLSTPGQITLWFRDDVPEPDLILLNQQLHGLGYVERIPDSVEHSVISRNSSFVKKGIVFGIMVIIVLICIAIFFLVTTLKT